MSGVSENNKRIAKNTIFMYFRMMLIMIVSLYTVRVVLQALGEADYGIYNIVVGVITMFTFITTTLARASMRFFSYDIDRHVDIRSWKLYFYPYWNELVAIRERIK